MLGALARRAHVRLPGAFLRCVPVRYIKATFVDSDYGIVSTAAGDVVTVQGAHTLAVRWQRQHVSQGASTQALHALPRMTAGLSKAAPMSLVTFSNGSTGSCPLASLGCLHRR